MNKVILIAVTALIFFLTFEVSAQIKKNDSIDDDENSIALKYSLISSLQSLANETKKLDTKNAQAYSKAEIAAALWNLDEALAKETLLQAFELILPREEEREKLKKQPVGANPIEPTTEDIQRFRVQEKINHIARRDKNFVIKLAQLTKDNLGRDAESSLYANQAQQAWHENNKEQTEEYLLRAIETEPTRLHGMSILQIAADDRKFADQLILQYISKLRTFQLSGRALSRVYFGLQPAVFPTPFFDIGRNRRIAPAGENAMRAYIRYVIESMTAAERIDPGSMMSSRSFLLNLWQPLNQLAPDLAGDFSFLEQATRGEREKLKEFPRLRPDEHDAQKHEDIWKKAEESRKTGDLVQAINLALMNKEFDKARKFANWIKDEAESAKQKGEIDSREAINLAEKGEIAEAQRLALKLQSSNLVLQTYPVILKKCAEKKDSSCAFNLSSEAARRLGKEENPAMRSRLFGSLAKSVMQFNSAFAFEAADEMVKAINKTDTDVENVNLKFDPNVFQLLAIQNENSAIQMAEKMQPRFARLIALAVIYQWKAEKFLNDSATRLSAK